MKTVAVFGSTGSIGTQTLDVMSGQADVEVFCLTAAENVELLANQAKQFVPKYVSLASQDSAKHAQLADVLPTGCEPVPHSKLGELASEADISVNGIVGFAGLDVTVSSLAAGKRLALANKESLIAAGPAVRKVRSTPGAELIPVDSEHSAIFQCLGNTDLRPSRIQLTASGGPFRGYSTEQLTKVGIEDALAHPTWSMGRKITIDSSTLANKGLEVIEAAELFSLSHGISVDDIDVVVHPQSIVHSMVTFSDGSTIAQLSEPDMRLPISFALNYPDRGMQPYGAIDWTKAATLEFMEPDTDNFKCLQLAFDAARIGGAAPAWFNAANEVAVEAFLNERISWLQIAEICDQTLQAYTPSSADTVELVVAADHAARAHAESVVGRAN